jgi:uncharacterized protein YecE (DUF72 family)
LRGGGARRALRRSLAPSCDAAGRYDTVVPAAASPERGRPLPNVRVGTASWTDPSLVESGRFYPKEVTTPEERLRYYATQFSFVEVDSTYYTVEFADQAVRWAKRTPDDFLFDVKAFRLLTLHQTPPTMLPREVREALGTPSAGKRNWYYRDLPDELRDGVWSTFEGSLAPLRAAGKLGAVVFQLPPWAMPGPEAEKHLLESADRLDGYRLAVEFRNKYWLSDRNRRRTLAALREAGIALVIVDEPQGFRSSVPPVWEVTDPALSVVRLHGRNAETWEKAGLKRASDRFNYLYSTAELREFIAPVRKIAQEAADVHVTFNNNYADYAQRNAAEFVRLFERDERGG